MCYNLVMNNQTSAENKAKNDAVGKIGVFDSGFGGLDIFRHISKELPDYDFVYLGDTARTPYGSRSEQQVYEYTKQGVDFLFDKGCQIIILACNTASADALRKIQQKHLPQKFGPFAVSNKNVLGVIIPATEQAVGLTKNNRIGVIATESSVNSGAFVREIQKIKPSINVYQKACPLLVPIVESGETSDEIIMPILKKCLQPLVEEKVDVLILGCTHYGILEDHIKRALVDMGSEADMVSEGTVVSAKLKDYLNRHNEISEKLSKNSSREFYTTDLAEKFSEIGGKIVGSKIVAQKVSLTE